MCQPVILRIPLLTRFDSENVMNFKCSSHIHYLHITWEDLPPLTPIRRLVIKNLLAQRSGKRRRLKIQLMMGEGKLWTTLSCENYSPADKDTQRRTLRPQSSSEEATTRRTLLINKISFHSATHFACEIHGPRTGRLIPVNKEETSARNFFSVIRDHPFK